MSDPLILKYRSILDAIRARMALILERPLPLRDARLFKQGYMKERLCFDMLLWLSSYLPDADLPPIARLPQFPERYIRSYWGMLQEARREILMAPLSCKEDWRSVERAYKREHLICEALYAVTARVGFPFV